MREVKTITDGSLNVGFWKIPLYDIPTNPTLPITNLGSLKLTSAYLWMRIALPGDNISQANGNSHPSEYKIPLPHQRGAAGMQNDRDFSFIPNKNVKPVKDPNYSANGIQIFLHYIRDYPSRSFNNIKVKCTLLQDGMPVSDENFTNMQWISKVFYSNDNLQQNKEGQQKMAEINADKEIGTTFTVLPILDSTVWKKDLYNMLWNNKLDSELVLVFDVMVDPDEFLSGRATLRMNNNDGTIKYGSYDLPVLSSDADQGRKQRLGYQLVCVINEPRTNELPKYPESRASKVSAPVKMNDNDDEEEEKIPKSKASKVSDLRGIAPSTATRDDDEPAFLPNSLKQYSKN